MKRIFTIALLFLASYSKAQTLDTLYSYDSNGNESFWKAVIKPDTFRVVMLCVDTGEVLNNWRNGLYEQKSVFWQKGYVVYPDFESTYYLDDKKTRLRGSIIVFDYR